MGTEGGRAEERAWLRVLSSAPGVLALVAVAAAARAVVTAHSAEEFAEAERASF